MLIIDPTTAVKVTDDARRSALTRIAIEERRAQQPATSLPTPDRDRQLRALVARTTAFMQHVLTTFRPAAAAE
jgi:hypothetical protein